MILKLLQLLATTARDGADSMEDMEQSKFEFLTVALFLSVN